MGPSNEYRPELFTPTVWPIDDDDIYDVFASQRRRFVIGCLCEHETALALADIADELASWEHNSHLTDVPAKDVKRVYLELYHCHIPKLEDAGIVDYRQDTDTVALTAIAEDIVSD